MFFDVMCFVLKHKNTKITHQVCFVCLCVLGQNTWFVIKHMNTIKTHDVSFWCLCIFRQNTWTHFNHVTCIFKYKTHVTHFFGVHMFRQIHMKTFKPCHVFFWSLCVLWQNTCLVIKHINSKKTHDVSFWCLCVFWQNTWTHFNHVTCFLNTKHMSHVFFVFICYVKIYMNTFLSCHMFHI